MNTLESKKVFFSLNLYLYKFRFNNYFQITGTNEAVENARAAVEDRIKEIDADKEDRQLRSFELEVKWLVP